MIDSHCHLDHEPLFSDLKNVIQRSKEIGVKKLLTISTSIESFSRVKEIVNKDEIIFGTIGIHPHEAKNHQSIKSEDIIKKTAKDSSKAGIFNNAGQHWNHILFWKCMKPKGGGAIPSELEKRIVSDFGSVDKFKEDFIQAGVTQFGSGWAWLAIDNGKLVVTKSANASNPLVDNMKPILGCDVWEHSYYVDYKNRRPDYLKAFINDLVNWEYVTSLLD